MPNKSWLRKRGKELNDAQIPSEVWFRKMWVKLYRSFQHVAFNKQFGPFIADVKSKKYKFVIEIDGSIHDTPEQKVRDEKKDKWYKAQGYEVYRVPAYNTGKFYSVVRAIGKRMKIFNQLQNKNNWDRKYKSKKRPKPLSPIETSQLIAGTLPAERRNAI